MQELGCYASDAAVGAGSGEGECGMAWVYRLGEEGVGCWVVGCQFPGADGAWCLLVDIDQGIYISGFLSRWTAGGFGSVAWEAEGLETAAGGGDGFGAWDYLSSGFMRMHRLGSAPGTLCEAIYEEVG